MIGRRDLLKVALAAFISAGALPAAAQSAPVATIETFSNTLLGVMKEGRQLGFAGRRDRLAPALDRTFDLPLMTRLMVGLQWPHLTPEQQRQLVQAFSNFSVATYANRFDDYSGERIQVEPQPVPTPNGDVIVHTRLIKGNGEAVPIDYLMRNDGGKWQVVDVYLNSTVSELATRRSEFSSVLRRGGPDALVQLLERKTAQLSS